MRKSLWLLLFSLGACTSDPVSPDLGHDFYPVALGNYWIYEVTETTYVDRAETIETYQLRESFFDQFENGGEITYLLKIERREDESDSWKSVESVGIKQRNAALEYQKNNQTFVKMTYPIRFCKEKDSDQLTGLNGGQCAEWDGNSQNEEDEELYHYRKLESTDFTFGDSEHAKLIISDFPPNFVLRDQRHEIYARGIGLVERSYDQVELCFSDCGGEVNLIQDGTILLQRLMEYGSE